MTFKRDRVLGMLLGLHVGDSLGAAMEFWPANADLSHTEIISSGPWRAGEPTDDTELMMAVLRSLKTTKELDLEDLRRSLIHWLGEGPKDVGTTTHNAIRRLERGESFGGLDDPDQQANGTLMRCCPLALMSVAEPILDQAISAQARLTHGSTTCQLGDKILIYSLRVALAGGSKSQTLVAMQEQIKKHSWFAKEFPDAMAAPWNSLRTSGWVKDTLFAAAWALTNAPSFERGLIQIVNRGDDADTAGAVAGCLMGAVYGVDSIPERWLQKIELKEKIEEEVTRLGF